MNSLRNVVVALVSLCLVFIVGYFAYIFTHGELADAAPYSRLQKIEFSHRGHDLGSAIVIDSGDGYKVLGVRTDMAAFPHAWIYLNRLPSEGDVMIIPSNSRFEASCNVIWDALKGDQVNSAVTAFLLKSCKS